MTQLWYFYFALLNGILLTLPGQKVTSLYINVTITVLRTFMRFKCSLWRYTYLTVLCLLCIDLMSFLSTR